MYFDDQNSRNSQSHEGYIPSEIPIPEIKGALPHHKKNIFPIISITVTCIVVVICALVGAGIVYYRSTPAYKIGKGLENLCREIDQSGNHFAEKTGAWEILGRMAEEGSHVETKLNFTARNLFENTIGVDIVCNKDMQSKELSADTAISMMNYEFAHFNICADDESVCFSIPELFMEDMYLDNKNVISQYNASPLAKWAGTVTIQDFSIDLFRDEGERIYPRGWEKISDYTEAYAAELKACRDKMTMEKAGKNVYRVVFPAEELNGLIRAMMRDCGLLVPALHATFVSEADMGHKHDVIESDISILLEINGKNRIESIVFENPVELVDGAVSVGGSLFFLGNVRSIDKIQGKIMLGGINDAEREMRMQILQSSSDADDTCTFHMDVELLEEEDSVLRIKYESESDGAEDAFAVDLAAWNEEEDIELILAGRLDDIVKGQSLEMDLAELSFLMDSEEMFKITGDISVGPPDGEVSKSVQKKTAFFEMTEEEWLVILYQIGRKYGNLLDYLW